MTLTNVVKSSCLTAAFLLMPASVFGAHNGCRMSQAQMSAANCPCEMHSTADTRSAQHQASLLLADIDRDAAKVRTQIDSAESDYPFVSTGWEIQADDLTMIRGDVNDMGQRLCRLETMHDQLSPAQQKAVDATAPLVKELAIFTTDAIHFVNGHRDNLYNPTYRTYLRDIHLDATQVQPAVHNEG